MLNEVEDIIGTDLVRITERNLGDLRMVFMAYRELGPNGPIFESPGHQGLGMDEIKSLSPEGAT